MIEVVVDDLATVTVDAIVRPTTTRLIPTTSVGERVASAGGPAFAAASVARDELAVGAAVVTAGGALPVEFVIHAIVGIDAAQVTATTLGRAWLSALERAKEWQFARIAVPPLHPGSPELRLAAVAETMLAVLHAHRATGGHQTSVSFVVESEEERAVFTAALQLSQDIPL